MKDKMILIDLSEYEKLKNEKALLQDKLNNTLEELQKLVDGEKILFVKKSMSGDLFFNDIEFSFFDKDLINEEVKKENERLCGIIKDRNYIISDIKKRLWYHFVFVVKHMLGLSKF